MLGLPRSKVTGEQLWVEIETVESTPDAKLQQIDQSSGHNIIETQSVEVADWEKNVDDITEVVITGKAE